MDRHKLTGYTAVHYSIMYTSIEQTDLEMIKIAAVSAWSAGHILSILVKGALSIGAIG